MSLMNGCGTSDPNSGRGFLESDEGTRIDHRVVRALEEYLALQGAACPPDRTAFLAGHPEIAEELASCLDGLAFVQSAALPFLGPAGDEFARTLEQALPESGRLGEFRIVRMLGRGGMGVVYEAEQVPLGRRVALKVLPSAASLDPMQRQRFRVEAQAAAHLQHPHIVPVFAVGSDQGAHYYAMQFIEGPTLAAVIRGLQLRRDRPEGLCKADPRPWAPGDLSGRGRGHFRAVARLGMQAAEALEHAHSLGVLHRDIKPANLMIDRLGALWVTDFGLARFQGNDGMTRTGELVGTLRYMSPEQARRGVVDQRTDIYALGLTLYELLTLRPAFEAQDRHELLRQIATTEPPALRRLEPEVPRDLETIVLKAAAKDPAHRYGTAGELAEDLRRFLEDRPIRARRPSPTELLARWARRHRRALTAAAAVLVLGSLLGGLVLGMAYRHAQYNNERARQALLRSFAVTDALAGDAMGQLATFERDPRGGLYFVGALAYYEEIANLYEADPQTREMAAAAYHRVGFVQALLRHVKKHPKFLSVEPTKAYRKAVELYDEEIAARPSALEPLEGLATTLDDLAGLQGTSFQAEEAERTFRRLVEIRRRLIDRPDGRLHLTFDLAMHGRSLMELGRIGEADELAAECEELWTSVAGPTGGADPDARAEVARYGNQVALVMAGYAPQRADRVLALAGELDPDDPSILNNLAWQVVKRTGATAGEARQALTLSRRAATASPGRWEMWNTLGLAQLRADDPRAAIDSLTRGMTLHNDGDANDWLPLAMALWRAGDRVAARSRFDEATRWIGRHPERLHADLGSLWFEAARLLELPQPLLPASPSCPRAG